MIASLLVWSVAAIYIAATVAIFAPDMIRGLKRLGILE